MERSSTPLGLHPPGCFTKLQSINISAFVDDFNDWTWRPELHKILRIQ